MSHEQKGAATGAGVGAVVGAVAGGLTDKKNPGQGALIGATAGALVGGAAGWAVGAYRVKQLKPREEAAAASHYTPQQGVVTKIDRTAATPQQLKPGDQLTVQSQYTVLGPPQNNQIRVREARTVFFNDQPLTELPPRELVLEPGHDRDPELHHAAPRCRGRQLPGDDDGGAARRAQCPEESGEHGIRGERRRPAGGDAGEHPTRTPPRRPARRPSCT